MGDMKRHFSIFSAALVLFAFIFFLWMFFGAATLEHAADLGRISARQGQDARLAAYEFAAKWRHGMAGNSPLYMPGFFAAAIAIWFWCAGKSLARMLVEGSMLIAVASWCAFMLAPFAAPRIIADFRAQGFIVSHSPMAGTGVAYALGVYTLLTWSALIIASRSSIKLRTPQPLAVPLVLYLVLALVRPWTAFAGLSSLWVSQTLAGEPAAVVSLLLVPFISGLMAWAALRSSSRNNALALTKRIESHQL